MKRKAFIIFVLTILIISTLFTGCKKKAEEKIAEKFIESVTGGEVDINKGTTTLKSEYGETIIGENLKWPKDIMGNLPELKANITMIDEDKSKNHGLIYFDGLKKDDAEKYVESLIELNYKPDLENTSIEGFVFIGFDDDGSEVYFSYSNNGSGFLSYTDKNIIFNFSGSSDSPTQNPDVPQDVDKIEGVDMTDDVPWPKDFLKDVPELEGKITLVSSSSSQDKFVYIEYVTTEDALDYVEKLKEVGFTETPYESISGFYLNYEASNENGDYIIFNWSNDGNASINFHKGE